MALFGFGRTRPSTDRADRARVAALARAAGGIEAEAAVTVSEILCSDPACPGLETVILILRPGRPTRAVKVAKAAAAVTEADVAAALAAGA